MTTNERIFCPQSTDPRDFRKALGQFGTGVTVVTCQSASGPLGFTANSFASVSMDPPLVLWSPAKSSDRHATFVGARHYAIHVLSADQQTLCEGFARTGDAFDLCNWHTSPLGVPLLDGSASRFECTQVAIHDGGDHSIIVGRVDQVCLNERPPLLFHGGVFGQFSPL